LGETQLVLAGYKGWKGADLVSGTDLAELGESLVQLGRVSDRDLTALYQGASVFALPSEHEGFGLPVLEAMNAGVAVVASDIPVMREIGGPAVLVPALDAEAWSEAIRDLMEDDERRHTLSRLGQAHSQSFTLDAMVRATAAVYRELVSN
jgi:alpha-1,3-rhamnosyl/mannosyltransferase